VNFAMGQQAQQTWTDGLGLPGLRPGLTPPDDLKGDPAYPTKPEDFARLISVSNKVQVQHEADWFKRFNEIMQG
jgi:putative spermidine/putrescine transport system substrate-binding protein